MPFEQQSLGVGIDNRWLGRILALGRVKGFLDEFLLLVMLHER